MPSADPSPEQIIAARDYLMIDVFGEFPFDDGPESDTGGASSRANFLSLLLQPFVRPMISGLTPMYLGMKPTPRTGASLLIRSALMINNGVEDAASQTMSPYEEEQRKRFTAAFKKGKTVIWVDNVTRKLQGDALANLVTASEWEDRELGSSTIVSYPNKMLVVMSGNNPRGSSEIMLRCVPIRLDAKRDPLGRKFKIEFFSAYVKENRSKLVFACLTLVNAWVAKGCPEFKERNLSGFEEWRSVMGGICETVGMPGFLGNLHLTQKSANDESYGWESFIYEWANPNPQRVGQRGGLDTKLKTSDLAQIYVDMDDPPNLGFQYNGDGDARHWIGKISNALSEKIGAPYTIFVNDQETTVCIKREKDPNSGGASLWKLVTMTG